MTRHSKTLTPADTRAITQKHAPEKELQAHLETLLSHYGFRWHHEQDSRKSAPGWPDLVAVRFTNRFDEDGTPNYPFVLFLEVKKETGTLSPEQTALWAELAGINADSIEIRCAVVRPSNLAEVEAWIRGRA